MFLLRYSNLEFKKQATTHYEAAMWVRRRSRADDPFRAPATVKPKFAEMPGSRSGKFQLASGHVPVDLLLDRLSGFSETLLDRVTS